MMRIPFDPEQLNSPEDREWWLQWRRLADTAIERAVDAWEQWKEQYDKNPQAATKFQVQWKNDIWGDLKEWLLEHVFHHKCAYCEVFMPRHYNDAEHHRPKGKVTYAKDSRQDIGQFFIQPGVPFPHPGYFWLAYNWKNLLPSCELCNSGKGKQNQFPLKRPEGYLVGVTLTDAELRQLKSTPVRSKKWPGTYYLDVEDLNEREVPMLLHPYFDQPREHLHFGPKGIETTLAGSEKAIKSIKVFRLDDAQLRLGRQRAQEAAKNKFVGAFFNEDLNFETMKQKAEQAISGFRIGEEPFSAAACDYIDDFKKSLA